MSKTLFTKLLSIFVLILSLIFGYQLFLLQKASPHRRHPVSSHNVSQISEWMTFEYINALFDLPPSYLQNALGITDSKYPRLTLKHYAKRVNKEISAVVADTQDAVRKFMNNSPRN